MSGPCAPENGCVLKEAGLPALLAAVLLGEQRGMLFLRKLKSFGGSSENKWYKHILNLLLNCVRCYVILKREIGFYTPES